MLIRNLVIGIAIAAAFGGPARAGGDGYDGFVDIDGAGPVFFGFVRDVRGATIPDALVVLRPAKAQPVSLKTNVMGLYRGHIGKGVSSDDVRISCEKPGYKEVKVVRRTPPGGNQGMVQTECTLQRL